MAKASTLRGNFHFLRDQVNMQKLQLEYCNNEIQLTGILTKPLTKPLKKVRFDEFKKLILMESHVNVN
jgi:hypothetical protein